MLDRPASSRLLSFIAFLGLGAAPLGLTGCELCISNCSEDTGAGSSDDGDVDPTTTSAGWTSTTWQGSETTHGSSHETETLGDGETDSISSTTCGGHPWGDTEPSNETDTWGGNETEEETEGLGCGGMVMPPDVVDMKMVRAGDMVPPPVAYTADTYFLVLRSQGNVCGPDPLAPPDCDDPEEFTLVVVIPPEFQAIDSYEFGDYQSETGFNEAELDAWIHIGGTASCETGVIPNSARLYIDTIEPDGSITGQICNFYWMPGLGQGLSGYIDASSC